MNGSRSLNEPLSRAGTALTFKLPSAGVSNAPKSEFRAPFEGLMVNRAAPLPFTAVDVVTVGELTVSALTTRSYYDVEVRTRNALVGFVDMQPPGAGTDLRRLMDKHTRAAAQVRVPAPAHVYAGVACLLWRGDEIEGKAILLKASELDHVDGHTSATTKAE